MIEQSPYLPKFPEKKTNDIGLAVDATIQMRQHFPRGAVLFDKWLSSTHTINGKTYSRFLIFMVDIDTGKIMDVTKCIDGYLRYTGYTAHMGRRNKKQGICVEKGAIKEVVENLSIALHKDSFALHLQTMIQ